MIRKKILQISVLAIVLWLVFACMPARVALAQSITLSPTSGPVNTVVSLTGSGFSADVAFQTYFAYGTTYQVVVGTGTVSATGTITHSFSVPVVPAGSYYIRVQTSTSAAVASYVVTSEINLSESSTHVGKQVSISGTGFGASRAVTIRFDGTQVATGSTDITGTFITSFTVPETFTGSHTITANDGIRTKITGLYVVQLITISPTSGAVGTTLTVSGTGFAVNRSISITYDGVTVTSVPSTVVTNKVGSFTARFNVPAGSARTVQVAANDGLRRASATFTLLAAIRLTPTTGKVGTLVTMDGSGFNAYKQVTVTFDNSQIEQVSTDGNGSFNTTFNVPATTSGQHQLTAGDGVKSASATFEVEANVVATPNAGKAGTRVSVSGSGFLGGQTVNVYFDNNLVTTATTNANGSFLAAFITAERTGGTHTISTSDGVYTATTNFLVQLNLALSPTSGQMGTQVNISGSGFNTGKTVTVLFSTTNIGTTATDANGSFSYTFTIPQLDTGSYVVNVNDGDNFASDTFTITTSFSINPTTGNIGSIITATGSGFSDIVAIKYDDDVVATVAVNAVGAFSSTFIVPVSIHGFHTITVSDGVATLQTTFTVESVPPPVPAVLMPRNVSRENARPTLIWQGVSDPSGVTYNLQIAGDAGFTNIILEKKELTTTQYSVTQAEKLQSTSQDSPYYWRVKAIDYANNQNDWSEPGSFYVSFLANWVKYILIGIGALIAALFIFWLGIITGRRPSKE